MAKSGIYAFGVIYQTKVVYVYQDKIGHVEKGKISIWIRLSIFRVAVSMRILGLDMGSKTIGVAGIYLWRLVIKIYGEIQKNIV